MRSQIEIDGERFNIVFVPFSILVLTFCFTWFFNKVLVYVFWIDILIAFAVSSALILYRNKIINIINYLRKNTKIN
jgi:hypothetical protein